MDFLNVYNHNMPSFPRLMISFFNIFHLNPFLSTLLCVSHDFFQYFKSHSSLALPPRTLPRFLIIHQWECSHIDKVSYLALCPVLLDLKSLNSSPLALCKLTCFINHTASLTYADSCVLSHSVVSDSLWPHGLYPTRLLCPWNSPGKNIGMCCHFLL